MVDLRSLSFDQLKDIVEGIGLPGFRAKQIFSWLHDHQIDTLAEITNISDKDLLKLEDAGYELLPLPRIVDVKTSTDGTRKFLFELSDGEWIESVLMNYDGDQAKKRYTACVSSQVGCAMNCSFCATGKMGFIRQLTAGEIVSQVYQINHYLSENQIDAKVGNVVYMGMGEPFNNLEAVKASLLIFMDEKGSNIGARRITVSTCGVVPGIMAFSDWRMNVGLAISLHAVTDELREQTMPVNKRWNISELIKACHYYQQVNNRRISFEYAVIAGYNDSIRDMGLLVQLLKGLKAHVNLIPINPTAEDFKPTDTKQLRKLKGYLQEKNISCSIREEKGRDICGACGQLRTHEAARRCN